MLRDTNTMSIMTVNFSNAHVDHLIRHYTGFTSLADMLNSHPSYRPSLATTCSRRNREYKSMTLIADAYDSAQARRGDPRRAYRY